MMKVTFSRLLNVVLAVLLLASVFLVNATTSRSNVTNIGAYDPWADINGDGIINILDAGQIVLGWQAQGDPTRNINITNWPKKYRVDSFLGVNVTYFHIIQAHTVFHPPINGCAEGYSRMSIQICVREQSDQSIGVHAWYLNWSCQESCSWDQYRDDIWNIGPNATTCDMGGLIEGKGPYYSLQLDVWPYPGLVPGWDIVDIFVYLRNE